MNIRLGLVAFAVVVSGGLFAAGCGDDSGGDPSGSNGDPGGDPGGGGSTDNVQACKDFYNGLTCGANFDVSPYVSTCANYDESTYPCDLADYFNCLSDAFKCVNDIPDVSGWQACAAQATCN